MGLVRSFARVAGRAVAGALPARLLRQPGLFEVWQRKGLHVLPVGYYSPVPDTRELTDAQWRLRDALPGVDMRESDMVARLERFAAAYGSDFARFPFDRPAAPSTPHAYHRHNGYFESVDGFALYGMIREHRPRRIIEIGSGHSTRLMVHAIEAARAQHPGYECELTTIDPVGGEDLRGALPPSARQIVKPVQEVPLDEFARLQAGDVLFIDSSHVLRLGSDVQYEMLEILPRVAPGVLVHVHDVFFPGEYPREWVLERHNFWNEQYILHAFLMFNSAFEVLWCSNWLRVRHEQRLLAAVPGYPEQAAEPVGGGTSFWMRRAR
jgi:hypothetical protein